jgi:hypothetical protein
MHSNNKYNILAIQHLEHHKYTLNNSKVRKNVGLYFTWYSTIFVLLIELLQSIILYLFLSNYKIYVSYNYAFIYVNLFCIYQSSFWNTIHPDSHYVIINISWYNGIPGWNGWKFIFSKIYLNQTTNLYDWFIYNHRLHHIKKGKYRRNYNITLPGADFIVSYFE